MFVTYCTNATLAIRENPSLRSVKVPASIDVAASYGVAVLKDASPRAASFVDQMLCAPGQAVLLRYGFSAR